MACGGTDADRAAGLRARWAFGFAEAPFFDTTGDLGAGGSVRNLGSRTTDADLPVVRVASLRRVDFESTFARVDRVAWDGGVALAGASALAGAFVVAEAEDTDRSAGKPCAARAGATGAASMDAAGSGDITAVAPEGAAGGVGFATSGTRGRCTPTPGPGVAGTGDGKGAGVVVTTELPGIGLALALDCAHTGTLPNITAGASATTIVLRSCLIVTTLSPASLRCTCLIVGSVQRGCASHHSNRPCRSHFVATHFSPAKTGAPPCRDRVRGWG